MRRCLPAGRILALCVLAVAFDRPAVAAEVEAAPFAVPEGGRRIGFDDMTFLPTLGKVVVPAGRTGNLLLLDPKSHAVTVIGGFGGPSESTAAPGGHGEGTTSADAGRGCLFAIDRTTRRLDVVDAAARGIVSSAPLGGGPDYVRFVPPTGEVWVTEPDAERIEIFRSAEGAPPLTVAAAGTVAIPGGPESLVIDAARGRAYTSLWSGTTVAIDLRTRKEVLRFPNGCSRSRGLALDAERGLLFAGCAEGGASVLDIRRGGALLDRARTGAGVDIIAFDPALSHLYVPSAKTAGLTVFGVSREGRLTPLGAAVTAAGAHCAAVDDRHQVWVCDPEAGRLLVFEDTFPPAGR